MAVMLSMTALSVEALPEPDLIQAARDGDDRAFEELYARYRDRIAAFIHSRVRDHGRAEDVAQDVFISALRRLRASEREIQFKPWIYEIAKNACIDEYRRTTRAREISLDAGDDESRPMPLLSLAPTPPAAMEAKQRMSDLQGAFGGLSQSHHQLLVLREFEGLSYDEIGARTGMSRQMVESALFRARRKLTEEYEELASGRRCEQVQAAIDAGRAISARALGTRERRRFARHLSHCQPCRVHAHLAGVDEALVQRKGVGAKIAAFLPFGLWRWPWGSGRARAAAVKLGSHPNLQALPETSEPAAAASLGGAAVAAAVLALAGAGAITAPAATPRHLVLRPAAHQRAADRGAPASAPGITTAPPGARARLARGDAQRSAPRSSRHAGASSPVARTGQTASGTSTGGQHGLRLPSVGSSSPGAAIRAGADLAAGVSTTVNQLGAGSPIAAPLTPVAKAVGSTTQSATNTLGGATDTATGAAGPSATAAVNAAGGAVGQTAAGATDPTGPGTTAAGSTVAAGSTAATGTVSGLRSTLGG